VDADPARCENARDQDGGRDIGEVLQPGTPGKSGATLKMARARARGDSQF